jgi:hypothetical protein
MDNRFVFRAPKCINPENFIKIRALLESLVYQYPRFLHLTFLNGGKTQNDPKFKYWFHLQKKILLKNEFRAIKKFRLSRGVADRSLVEICIDNISAVLRFEISVTFRQLGWIDEPHSQNF